MRSREVGVRTMRTRRRTAWIAACARPLLPLILALGCVVGQPVARSGPAPSPPAPSPRDLLERAIAQAGGTEALERARALAWRGEATVHAGGRTVEIAGRWAVQPPDTAVVTTWLANRGEATARALVLAAPSGWVVSGAQRTAMEPAFLASERDAFYLYDVIRLVGLRAPGVTLQALAPDSLGRAGLLARQPGRPDVRLRMDARGRLVHVQLDAADAAGGAAVPQDAWLSGELEADGVRWPGEIRILQRGAPYFTLRLRELRVMPRLDDPLLTGTR